MGSFFGPFAGAWEAASRGFLRFSVLGLAGPRPPEVFFGGSSLLSAVRGRPVEDRGGVRYRWGPCI